MFSEIILPTTFLVIFIILITAIILVVYKALTPRHEVEIRINKSRIHSIQAGDDVLTTLRQQNVLLPSSCAGKGTCGLCRCQLSPSPEPLPIEKNFLTAQEIKKGYRLACQHHLFTDIDITVPDYVLNATKITTTVKEIRSLASSIKEITLTCPSCFSFTAGDYVLVEIPIEGNEIITRAYSISSYPNESEKELKLTISLASSPAPGEIPDGIGSSWLFSREVGNEIEISGPFGDFHLQASDREKCFIGGGAGMAPLRSQILTLLHSQNSVAKISFWYGARNKSTVIYRNEMKSLEQKHQNFTFHPGLSEETSKDFPHGFIHQIAFDNYLKSHPEPENIEFYICGPAPMINATIEMLHSIGVDDEMIFFDNFG